MTSTPPPGPAQPRLRPQHVLITGGAGFIGSHLCREFLGRGVRVSVLDDLSTGRSESIAPLIAPNKVRFVRGSVCDPVAVARALQDRPDVIVHLAAAVGVRLIVERPVQSIATNIRGTEVVLEAAAESNIKTLIASSSEVYGKSAATPFGEEDDLVLGATTRPRWSYACSKMIDEFLALAYHRAQALPVVVMRFFNTVGPGQSGQYGMVIPRLVRQALRNEALTVYGDGRQQRAFCHVRDTARMIADLAELPAADGRIFNVGNDAESSILELASLILDVTASRSAIKLIPFTEAYDQNFEDLRRRVPDLRAIQGLLGYKPERGIRQIVEEVRDDEQKRLS